MLGPHTPLSQTRKVSVLTSSAKTAPWPGPLFLKGPRPSAVYSQKLLEASFPPNLAPNPLSQAVLPPAPSTVRRVWLLFVGFGEEEGGHSFCFLVNV